MAPPSSDEDDSSSQGSKEVQDILQAGYFYNGERFFQRNNACCAKGLCALVDSDPTSPGYPIVGTERCFECGYLPHPMCSRKLHVDINLPNGVLCLPCLTLHNVTVSAVGQTLTLEDSKTVEIDLLDEEKVEPKCFIPITLCGPKTFKSAVENLLKSAKDKDYKEDEPEEDTTSVEESGGGDEDSEGEDDWEDVDETEEEEEYPEPSSSEDEGKKR